MLIKNLQLGHLETNCYVVTDEASLLCAVIDPGDESNTVLHYLEQNRLTCKAILLTHGHFDHTGAVLALMEETGAALYMGQKDANVRVGRADYFFTPPPGTIYVTEGQEITVGALTFTVIETPGHTPGGVTYRCENALFTGDTLFKDSCGRTDFDGGDMNTLMASLRKLADLPGDFEVYPGHLGSTTLARERRSNYYLTYAMQNR